MDDETHFLFFYSYATFVFYIFHVVYFFLKYDNDNYKNCNDNDGNKVYVK